MSLAGSTVRIPWTIRDGNNDPISGLATPADITFLLKRDNGVSVVLASEAVAMAEDGVTGTYTISFTPVNSGNYFLQLREINVNSQLRTETFAFPVYAAGSVFVPAFANSFCSEQDVERWSQLQYDASSHPTDTEVAGFAEARAAEIEGVLAGAGFEITPSSVTPGSVEQDLLREANAIAAAADSVLAKFMRESPSKTDKAEALLEEYKTRLERLVAYARQILSSSSLRTPFTEGLMTEADETSIQDAGLRVGISMEDEF